MGVKINHKKFTAIGNKQSSLLSDMNDFLNKKTKAGKTGSLREVTYAVNEFFMLQMITNFTVDVKNTTFGYQIDCFFKKDEDDDEYTMWMVEI